MGSDLSLEEKINEDAINDLYTYNEGLPDSVDIQHVCFTQFYVSISAPDNVHNTNVYFNHEFAMGSMHSENQGIENGATSVGKSDLYTKENDDYKQTPFYLGNNPNFLNTLNDVDVNKAMDKTESNDSLAGMRFTTEGILGKSTKK